MAWRKIDPLELKNDLLGFCTKYAGCMVRWPSNHIGELAGYFCNPRYQNPLLEGIVVVDVHGHNRKDVENAVRARVYTWLVPDTGVMYRTLAQSALVEVDDPLVFNVALPPGPPPAPPPSAYAPQQQMQVLQAAMAQAFVSLPLGAYRALYHGDIGTFYPRIATAPAMVAGTPPGSGNGLFIFDVFDKYSPGWTLSGQSEEYVAKRIGQAIAQQLFQQDTGKVRAKWCNPGDVTRISEVTAGDSTVVGPTVKAKREIPQWPHTCYCGKPALNMGTTMDCSDSSCRYKFRCKS